MTIKGSRKPTTSLVMVIATRGVGTSLSYENWSKLSSWKSGDSSVVYKELLESLEKSSKSVERKASEYSSGLVLNLQKVFEVFENGGQW